RGAKSSFRPAQLAKVCEGNTQTTPPKIGPPWGICAQARMAHRRRGAVLRGQPPTGRAPHESGAQLLLNGPGNITTRSLFPLASRAMTTRLSKSTSFTHQAIAYALVSPTKKGGT